MKAKIAIVVDTTFTKRDYQRFGIKTLKKKFNVFIFDFTKKFSTKLAKYKFFKKTYKCKGYYSVNDLSVLKKMVLKHNFSNCINYISNQKLEYKVIDILKKNKIPIIIIQNGLAIGPGYPRSLLQNIHILLLKFTNFKKFKYFIKNLFYKFKNKLLRKNPIISDSPSKAHFDKVVITGLKGIQVNSINKKTKIIYAHSFDYDNYLKNINKKELNEKKPYAVFLDQYLPLHPDAPIFFGVSPRCTAEKYYPALNNFFNIFEKNFNMKVIICAHPKSEYETKKNYLYGRKFIKNKTLELVKNSSLVFAHSSTTISYAILCKKPLVFLISNEYIESFDNYTPAVIANKLNSPCINIDNKSDLKKMFNTNFFSVDKEKYKIYKDEYIKYPSSIKKPFWEIFNRKI